MKERKNIELEKAMNKVLFTQFKKDAKEAHKIVEDAGYEIYKYDGFFGIRNTKRGKNIRINKALYYRGEVWEVLGRELTAEEISNHYLKVDIVDYFTKPVNTEWYRLQNPFYNSDRPTISKYNSLEINKEMLVYREREVESLKKNIAELQEKLIEAVEKKIASEVELKKTRERLGLKGRR